MKCSKFPLFPQAEGGFRVAQADFDRQYEITKLLLEGVTSAQVCIIHNRHFAQIYAGINTGQF